MSEKADNSSERGTDKEGMPVLGCIDGSAAAIAGIRVGDRLLEVNGVPVSDASSYIAARALECDMMHVVLRRNEKIMKLTLHFESYTRKLLTNLTLN
jgi:S1-C subfamily serine protease